MITQATRLQEPQDLTSRVRPHAAALQLQVGAEGVVQVFHHAGWNTAMTAKGRDAPDDGAETMDRYRADLFAVRLEVHSQVRLVSGQQDLKGENLDGAACHREDGHDTST